MGPSPENTCVSEEVGSGATDTEKPASSKPQTTDSLTYHELLQEYTQLRERFLRTTNALGSAAHDLKTPLAILNGYVELLQSEKLGTLNDRQREVLHDMRSSGQRLQQFIQDFLSFSVLETGQTNPLPNSVKVSVSDTGPGIPAEYHIEVFDDFFRLPQNENQAEGMGLGLAIARRLVNSMGGKIWVESEPGTGCKFSFIIPLKPVTGAGKGKSK